MSDNQPNPSGMTTRSKDKGKAKDSGSDSAAVNVNDDDVGLGDIVRLIYQQNETARVSADAARESANTTHNLILELLQGMREDREERRERREREARATTATNPVASVETPVTAVTPATQFVPSSVTPVVKTEEDDEDDYGVDYDYTPEDVDNKAYSTTRGTRGGAGKAPGCYPRINAYREKLARWETVPFSIGENPAPADEMVRLIFPPLAKIGAVVLPPDTSAEKAIKPLLMKPNLLPPLARHTDPDIPAKLVRVQDTLNRQQVPTTHWGMLLAYYMKSDFEEMGKTFLPNVPWHHCVFAIITNKRGYRAYIQKREEAVNAAKDPPPTDLYGDAIERLTKSYELAPILIVEPQVRLSLFVSTLTSWGAEVVEKSYDMIRDFSNGTKLYNAAEYTLVLRNIRTLIRTTFEDYQFHLQYAIKSSVASARVQGLANDMIYAGDEDCACAVIDEVFVVSQEKFSGNCFNCGKKGHFARDCPVPKRFKYQSGNRAVGSFRQQTTANRHQPAAKTGSPAYAVEDQENDEEEKEEEEENAWDEFDQSRLLSNQQ